MRAFSKFKLYNDTEEYQKDLKDIDDNTFVSFADKTWKCERNAKNELTINYYDNTNSSSVESNEATETENNVSPETPIEKPTNNSPETPITDQANNSPETPVADQANNSPTNELTVIHENLQPNVDPNDLIINYTDFPGINNAPRPTEKESEPSANQPNPKVPENNQDNNSGTIF